MLDHIPLPRPSLPETTLELPTDVRLWVLRVADFPGKLNTGTIEHMYYT
jgi:hypothetical protein